MTKFPLSDEQVAKIAGTIEGNNPLQSYLEQFEIDIPALCATVKALRAENERLNAIVTASQLMKIKMPNMSQLRNNQ